MANSVASVEGGMLDGKRYDILLDRSGKIASFLLNFLSNIGDHYLYRNGRVGTQGKVVNVY
jgi:hypothetical protein